MADRGTSSSVHTHLGHLKRPAGEDGKPPQQRLLALGQQVVAPVDGGAQRLLPWRGRPVAGGQQAEPVGDPHPDLLHRQRADPGGGQLDASGMPSSDRQIAATASALAWVSAKPGAIAAARSVKSRTASAADPSADATASGGTCQIRLARDPQRLAAGGDQAQVGRGGEQPLAEPGAGLKQVLAVVEREHHRARAQRVGERVEQRAALLLGHADRGRDPRHHEVGAGDVRQLYVPRAVGELVGQPRRARAARAGSCRCRPGRSASPSASRTRACAARRAHARGRRSCSVRQADVTLCPYLDPEPGRLVPQWRMGPHLHTDLHISDDAARWPLSLASMPVGYPRASLFPSLGTGFAEMRGLLSACRRCPAAAGFVRGPLAAQQGPGRRGRNVWGGCGARRRLSQPATFAAGRGHGGRHVQGAGPVAGAEPQLGRGGRRRRNRARAGRRPPPAARRARVRWRPAPLPPGGGRPRRAAADRGTRAGRRRARRALPAGAIASCRIAAAAITQISAACLSTSDRATWSPCAATVNSTEVSRCRSASPRSRLCTATATSRIEGRPKCVGRRGAERGRRAPAVPAAHGVPHHRLCQSQAAAPVPGQGAERQVARDRAGRRDGHAVDARRRRSPPRPTARPPRRAARRTCR